MNLIKGQISKLSTFDIIIGGHSKSMFVVVEGGRGVLNKETKTNRGRGDQAYLYICSVKKENV